jgi:hypothetical protein
MRPSLPIRRPRSRSRRLAATVAAGFVLALLMTGCGQRQGSNVGSTTATTGGRTTALSPTTPPPTATTPATTPTTTPPVGTWKLLPAAPIAGPYGPAGVWDGKEVIVAGRIGITPPPYSKDLAAAYAPASNAWHRRPGAPGPEGMLEGADRAVWTGKEMLLWGVTNTAFDPARNAWRTLPDPPAGEGGGSVAVWTGHQMIGWGGGCCGEVDGDGAAYTTATNSWKLLPRSPLSPRHTQGAWTGTEMILAGGEGGEGEHGRAPVYRDAAAYDPSTRTWRRLAPMPIARAGAEVVWDGRELLVIGGTGPDHQGLARGVAYDPSTNRWRWLAPMAYPRAGFVAVWSGDRLLVWGGYSVGGGHVSAMSYPPHGEAYDPATDTWSALPKAPIRHRSYAIGVWTGSAMFVWGGEDEHGPVATGAIYTP